MKKSRGQGYRADGQCGADRAAGRPLAGAALMELAPWRTSFLLIAVLSFLALLGLLWKMPETTQPSHESCRWRGWAAII